MTETPARPDSRSPHADRRGWTYFAWWLLAWNAAVPIRLIGILIDGAGRPGFRPAAIIGPQVGSLVLEQTSWAVVTYVMFRLALRARRQPLRQVLILLGVLAIPLMVLRFGATAAVMQAFGRPAPPAGRVLWFNGPLYLFLLMAAAALGLLVVYMQRERDSAVLQANLQAELASARLQTLRLQLNPHFLFNALNSIASLVPSDTAKADAAIAALSSFLRATLSLTRGDETTLEDELRLVDAYLEIEVVRFEWLTVDLDVPDALRSACVPAFVLQLLVENAIRHGLAPRRTPGRVLIAARLSGDRLTLAVSDDGVGFGTRSGDGSLGIGLQNVRARLAQLYGADGRLTLEPAVPQGTVAMIHIPYHVCHPEPAPSLVDA
ncbi:MAG TPA: histidine kinase [Gemmatimonadaceae bacterium]|nr:histidine kinase [Gemmatimonadaceae bacterium]